MTTERIEELTTELKALRVRETSIIEEIERENRSRRTTESRPRRTTTTAPPTELEAGARVYIKNQVRKPANWDDRIRWNPHKERKATVTKVTPAASRHLEAKVHLTTDNGTRTWRAAKNVRPLLEDNNDTHGAL